MITKKRMKEALDLAVFRGATYISEDVYEALQAAIDREDGPAKEGLRRTLQSLEHEDGIIRINCSVVGCMNEECRRILRSHHSVNAVIFEQTFYVFIDSLRHIKADNRTDEHAEVRSERIFVERIATLAKIIVNGRYAC